tara:strand:- start:81 stop:632 length:552 start_codon:yes stop_codon:yes gene_type:complete
MAPDKTQGRKKNKVTKKNPVVAETSNSSPELEEALREAEQFRNLAQRVQADFINYKRRLEEEKLGLEKYVKSGILLKILGIADDFERGLSHMSNEEIPDQWFEGIRLIQRKLESFLESEGIKIIEALGFDFNPIEHEAVFYEEAPEGSQGKVISVLTNGYKLHDKVLRPAQVTVGKQPESPIN